MDTTDHLYTPRQDAVTELLRRRRELACPPVDDLEALLSEAPSAVLIRQVATPSFEILRFTQLAESLGLRPLVLEYKTDLFVTHNEAKLALGQMRFAAVAADMKGPLPRRVAVIDMNGAGGKPLGSVQTLWGQNLMEFHHELFKTQGLGDRVKVADISPWFQQHGGSAQKYYGPVFHALRDRAIQFETYLPQLSSEGRFTHEVVIPAFDKIAGAGRKPLVCRLDPKEMEGSPSWYYYPKTLEVIVDTKLELIAPKPRRIQRFNPEYAALAA